MAFPTTSLVNNQVHKEGNRAWVYDSTVGVWDQVREVDNSPNNNAGFPPAGHVIQVVSSEYSTYTVTTSNSWHTTNLNCSITPKSTSSRILVSVMGGAYSRGLGTYRGSFTLFRGTVSGTNLGNETRGFGSLLTYTGSTGYHQFSIVPMTYLDSPSTASSQMYTVAMKAEGNSTPTGWCGNGSVSTMTLTEVAG